MITTQPAELLSNSLQLVDSTAAKLAAQAPWLYDTGSTCYICNNLSWFSGYSAFTGTVAPVITAGGSLTPRGLGTVKLKVHCSGQKYSTLTLKKVLFILEFSVNIVLGALYYLSGGSFRGLTLFNSEDKALATLNFQQLGFYLFLKEMPQTLNQSANSYAIKGSRLLL